MNMIFKILRRNGGFTLTETLGAVVLLGLSLATAMASFSYVMRNERRIVAEGELDMDTRMVIERMRRDLWTTSREMVLLHPEGEGPYDAISFPIIRGDGAISRDEDGNIEWDATVVYHLWEGPPHQVRRTVFSPRANLTEAQRLGQLASVAEQGGGNNTHNGDNASTRAIITNLVDWELNITGSRFDAYSRVPGRRSFNLGSVLLGDGSHDFTFRVVGQNSEASGASRYLGVDTLSASASALRREGEWQNVSGSAGTDPLVQNMGEGETWSGNSKLWFPATADGNSFTLTMHNDRWEERNFFDTSVKLNDLKRIFIRPDDTPHTFALQLDGNGIAWEASKQTRDSGADTGPPHVTHDTAIRVFVRGNDIADTPWTDFDGGWIEFNGKNVWATFSSGGGPLRIEEAFIAESAINDDGPAMNYIPETRTDLLFGGSQRVTFNGIRESDKAEFNIDKDKSYLISIRVQDPPDALLNMRMWTASGDTGTPPSSFVVENADSVGLNDPAWSERGDVHSRYAVYALQSVRTGHSPEGVYLSQIIDTQIDDPDFSFLEWIANTPEQSSVEFKARAGNESDLSDAPEWDSVPVAENGFKPLLDGRYVQVRAKLEPGTDGLASPIVRDFTLQWKGTQRFVDVAGIFSTGPDHGIYEVLVNGNPLLQGVTIDLTVYKDISLGYGKANRLTSSAFAEIVPRNAGN